MNGITDAKTKQKELVNKSNTCNLIKSPDLKKITIKELKAKQDKIVKLQMHDLSFYLSKIFLVIIVFKIGLFVKQHLMY